MQNSIRGFALWFCFLYGIFIVYGSFVPLNVNSLSFNEAVNQFWALQFLDFKIINRSDWFTNYLLFIPLSYALLFVLPATKNFASLMVKLAVILIFLMALSITIEFFQMFISVRVSSFKDVFAQFLGTLTGFTLFYFSRHTARSYFSLWMNGEANDKWLVYASGLVVVFTFYNLMPLDLSISPVEIYNKWHAGKINLLPFYKGPDPIIPYVFGIVSDFAIWFAIATLYLKSGKYTVQKILLICVLLSLIVEFLQLFVLSRYTDITDVITATIGGIFASKVSPFFDTSSTSLPSTTKLHSTYKIISVELILVLWCLILLFFALFPAELIQSKSEFLYKWRAFFAVPFETYWRGNPYSAITQLLRKVVLTIPLGMLITAVTFKYQVRKKYFIFPILFGCFYVLGLELLQLLLVNKVAVLSDVILNIGGLCLGYIMFKKHQNKGQYAVNNANQHTTTTFPVRLFLSILAVYVFLLAMINFDKTPYNVKELFDQFPPFVSAGLISIVLFFAMGFPKKWVEILVSKDRFDLVTLVFSPILHCVILFNLVYLTFPLESIHDILGFPVWHSWPTYLELGYRFIGFYLFISGAFFAVASWYVESNIIAVKTVKILFSLIYMFIFLPVSFIVIVIQAGTDNIVELLQNNGYSFKLLWISLYLVVLVFLSTSWLPKNRPAKTFYLGFLILLTIGTGPLGFFLVEAGLQELLIKYGQPFSALQFLLSPSREQLLQENQLFPLFCILHFCILVVIYCVIWSLDGQTGRRANTVMRVN
ncbi:VanZ family protein [Paraglaciecola sp. 25GB23A]|uniref:VanZ family protein n=1 Tax=Paraglaciecola sp. 25GB23A TaxID=3156068 RepID=UPI0032AF2706